MPIRNAIWRGNNPQSLAETRLPNERVLEDIIVAAPRILSDEWMLIGRQERTGSGGRVAHSSSGWGAMTKLQRAVSWTPCHLAAQNPLARLAHDHIRKAKGAISTAPNGGWPLTCRDAHAFA